MYFKATICTDVTKDPALDVKTLQEYAIKKGKRGEFYIHPALAPVSLVSACSAVGVTTLAYN